MTGPRSPLWWAFARWVARSRCRSGLDGVWTRGLDAARARLAAGPVVFAATHSSVWDPLVTVVLAEGLGGSHAWVMDAANLAKVGWFGAVGALPLDPASPRAGLKLAASHLSGPGQALWIFPQGRHRPPWLRPLGLAAGADWLARRPGVTRVPVALAYGFHEAPAPRAAAAFGDPGAGLEEGLVDALAATDAFFADSAAAPFEAALASRQRREDDGVPSRLLSWLAARTGP